MADQFDVDLQDPVLLDEIRLLTEVVVAATASPVPLSPEAVDGLLLAAAAPAPGDPDVAHRVRDPG
jgi:hypothetical protein